MMSKEEKYFLEEEEKTGNEDKGSGGSSDTGSTEERDIKNHIGDDLSESYRPTDELNPDPPTGDED